VDSLSYYFESTTRNGFCSVNCSVLNIERGVEEIQADEAVDCQVMELLRNEVLPHSQYIPHQFILRVVMLLNKGSIHSATIANIGTYNIYNFYENSSCNSSMKVIFYLFLLQKMEQKRNYGKNLQKLALKLCCNFLC